MLKKIFSKLIKTKKLDKIPEEIYRAVKFHFDIDYYLEEYEDVRSSKMDGVEHYILFGEGENRIPTSWFNSKEYKILNPHISKLKGNFFYYYLSDGQYDGYDYKKTKHWNNLNLKEREEVEEQYNMVKPYFNVQFYIKNYNVNLNYTDPLLEYLTEGWKNLRDPCDYFSTAIYLQHHADVKSAKVVPLYHYVCEGHKEERYISSSSKCIIEDKKINKCSSSALSEEDVKFQIITIKDFFDEKYYLAKNKGVSNDALSPIEHYLTIGWKELLDPSPDFSTRFYLDDNPDVVEASINPLFHYIVSGKVERRYPRRPGGAKSEIIYSLKSLSEVVDAWKVSKSTALLTEDKAILAMSLLEEKVILSVSHDIYFKNIGGVQLCIGIEEKEAAKNDISYLHIAPYQPLPILSKDEDGCDLLFHISVNGIYIGVITGQLLINTLSPEKKYMPVIHALHGHSPEYLTKLFFSLNVEKYCFWIHDYFSICESYNLLRNTVSFCKAPDASSKECGICMYGNYRELHINRIDKFFNNFSVKVIAPSNSAKQTWLDSMRSRNLGFMDSCDVIKHIGLVNSKSIKNTNTNIKIAFLGYPTYHKGGEDFIELVNQTLANESVEFYHFGRNQIESPHIKYIECKVTSDRPNAMIDAIKKHTVDYVFIPAKWPETFNITCYEAIAGGAEILTYSDVGNVSDFVRKSKLGLVFNDLYKLISVIKNNKLAHRSKHIYYEIKYSGMANIVLEKEWLE